MFFKKNLLFVYFFNNCVDRLEQKIKNAAIVDMSNNNHALAIREKFLVVYYPLLKLKIKVYSFFQNEKQKSFFFFFWNFSKEYYNIKIILCIAIKQWKTYTPIFGR